MPSPSLSGRAAPLVLVRRLGPDPAASLAAAPQGEAPLRLPLCADERTSLRGHRRSACGRDLLLQLPRGGVLEPGDRLAPAGGGPVVVVEAASEPLLVVRSLDPLALLQAAYHLGNRHVAIELQPGELRLRADGVLEDLLRQRGLSVTRISGPFGPEPGAYEGAGHSHSSHHLHSIAEPGGHGRWQP